MDEPPLASIQDLVDLYTSALVSRASPHGKSFARRSPDQHGAVKNATRVKNVGRTEARDGEVRRRVSTAPLDSVLRRPGSAPPPMIVAGSLQDMMQLIEITPRREMLRPRPRSGVRLPEAQQPRKGNNAGAQEDFKTASHQDLAALQVCYACHLVYRRKGVQLTSVLDSWCALSWQRFDPAIQTLYRKLSTCPSGCRPQALSRGRCRNSS